MSANVSHIKKIVNIDSQIGGGGDIWMRLLGFYTLAGLNPSLEIHILIPEFMKTIAKHVYGDRLIISDNKSKSQLTYTVLGFRHLIKGLISGNRYISPYQYAVIHDKKKKETKDILNKWIFKCADLFNLIQVPPLKFITYYQGFLEVIALKLFRNTSYEAFKQQMNKDADDIKLRLNYKLPISEELLIPTDLKSNVIVFPNGTGRQFVPLTWALTNLPDAYYSFFHKDESLIIFKNAGLKTILFFKPADIIELSKNAAWTITTDSFPSHLLQSYTNDCAVAITGTLQSRIVSPVFAGVVIQATAPCHPCLHLDRNTHKLCSAGFTDCINWQHADYTSAILKSVRKK
jgi:hypothetical protein